MRLWLIRITAVEAYLGNRHDPLLWHFTISARTATDAVSIVRKSSDSTFGVKIEAFPEGQW